MISTGSNRRRLILASASPARLATLRSAGIEPEVVVSGVVEDVTAASPTDLAVALAVAKASAVASRPESVGAVVLGCDSLLELDGVAMGKPGCADAARRRWHQMRGRSGVLITGHCLIDVDAKSSVSRAARTTVYFADLSDDEVDAYVATGEPLHVAGAFTIDGLGGPFVTRVDGDPHNVVGVSLPLVREMLHMLGYEWTQLWRDGDRPPVSPGAEPGTFEGDSGGNARRVH